MSSRQVITMRSFNKALIAVALGCIGLTSTAATLDFGTGLSSWAQTYTQGEFRLTSESTNPFLLLDTFDCGPS
jgi:hypothetical protein